MVICFVIDEVWMSCQVYWRSMSIFTRYSWLVYPAMMAGIFLGAVVVSAQEGEIEGADEGQLVEVPPLRWMEAFQLLGKYEIHRFLSVNPEAEYVSDDLEKSLLAEVRKMVSERSEFKEEPNIERSQFLSLIPPDHAEVFREAFTTLKAAGIVTGEEVENYVRDLELTVGAGIRFKDLCGVYLLQQLVPISRSQAEEIIRSGLYSKQDSSSLNLEIVMSFTWRPFISLFSLIVIPDVMEILEPEQKEYIEKIRALTEGKLNQERVGIPMRLNMQLLIEESGLPLEERTLTQIMQGYSETAIRLWQREYGLDTTDARKLGVAARMNLGKSIEYFSSDSISKLHPMKQGLFNQMSCTHLIHQQPTWQKMLEKVSSEAPPESGSPAGDYSQYVDLCQELNLHYLLMVLTVYGGQMMGGNVESDGLTGAQFTTLLETFKHQISNDEFQDLPDFRMFLFILNDKREELAKVLNAEQMKVIDAMSRDLSQELNQGENIDNGAGAAAAVEVIEVEVQPE